MVLKRDRALWRDSHALFQEVDDSSKRPEVFNHLARVSQLREVGGIIARRAYSFSVYGFATDPGKAASITFWRHERLPLPLVYLSDQDLSHKLQEALQLAEKVGELFSGGFVEIVARGKRFKVPSPLRELASLLIGSHGSTKEFVDQLAPGQRYWSRLEASFKAFLVKLPEDRFENSYGDVEYGARELPEWARTLREAATDAFSETIGGLDKSARALKAAAVAERQFDSRLREILGYYLDQPARAVADT